MRRSLIFATVASVIAGPAWAGPAHVLRSRVVAAAPAGAVYAVSPDLGTSTRKALTEALEQAGLKTVNADQPHAYLVTVRAAAGPLCTASRALPCYEMGPLADNYRHEALVVAQANSGATSSPEMRAAWYTLLQSDGLSNRTGDYLPALLRYGARAYGRDTTPEAAPRLVAIPTLTSPNVAVSPG